MRHLKDDNVDFFKFLTAEEQLDEVREFIFTNSGNFTPEHLITLEKMLGQETRNKTTFINSVAHMNHVFCCETNDCVLNDKQKEELKQMGVTTVLVPKTDNKVFGFWARSEGFDYKQIVEHTVVGAYEYLIWRASDGRKTNEDDREQL